MSTKINDLVNNITQLNSINTTGRTTGNTIGSTGDFKDTENPCTLIVDCFSPLGALSYQIKVQESTDGTTWVDVSGASIAAATTTGSSSVAFNRNLRYVAAYSTVASSTTGALLAKILAPLKQVPS